MRFAHFMPTFPQRGGTGVAVEGLMEAAGRRGRADVILSYGPAAADGDVSMPWPTRLLVSSPWPLPFLVDPVAARLMGLEGLDALLLHGVFTPSCSRMAMRARRGRPELPIVAVPHDAYDAGLFSSKAGLKHAYWKTVERPYLQRADLIVVAAPLHSDLLRRAGVRTATVVGTPGLSPRDVDRAAHALAARARRPIGSPLRLLALGRWDVHEKGLDLLAEAADDPSLRNRITVRLVGPEFGARPQVESLLHRYRLDNFEAVGWVDDPWPELTAADALVLPSRKEGFGLVALQALASGLPAMVSTVAGMAEHLDRDDGVVLVRPDAASVRAGLHELVDRPAELTRLARDSSGRLATRFTWDRMLDDLLGAVGQLDGR